MVMVELRRLASMVEVVMIIPQLNFLITDMVSHCGLGGGALLEAGPYQALGEPRRATGTFGSESGLS